MTIRLAVALATFLAFLAPARAQWGDLLDRAQQKAQEAVEKAAEPPARPAPEEPPARGEEAPAAPAPRDASAPSARPPTGGAAAAAGTGSTEPADVAPGEVYSARFDFVPGERVFFFDDFGDTGVGDYPRRWTLGEGGGPVEVAEIQGRRWLMSMPDEGGVGMRETHSYVRSDLEKEYPDKFTLEFDAPSTAELCVTFSETFWTTGSDGFCFGPTYADMYWAGMKNESIARPVKPLRHVAVAVSGTSVKVYFDGQRVLNHPEAVRVRHGLRAVGFRFKGDDERKRNDQRFTSVQLAEGGKDYAKELLSGRIVTHGITFDTGSDVIRPTSGPTLRKVLALLQENPALAFEVQGHTDSQGGDKVNGPLSARRAASVKAWLVGQGIAEKRLTTRGLGATKPLRPNDTAEGRAENRRVEFVKTAG